MQEEAQKPAQNEMRCGNDTREMCGKLTSNLRVGGSNPSERATRCKYFKQLLPKLSHALRTLFFVSARCPQKAP